MDEVERIADRVAIIDNGKIIANDTAANIIANSGTKSLEEAFIKMTGHIIRVDEATAADAFRKMAAMHQGKNRR